MTQKELLHQVERLENRLLEQIKITKERDAKIARLEDKLRTQRQQACQISEIRQLALKIGMLCDPPGTNRATLQIVESATPTNRSPIVRTPEGTPIFLSSDILERAPSFKTSNSDDDTLYHFRHQQNVETAGAENVEQQQTKDGKVTPRNTTKEPQEKFRRDSEFYSTAGRIGRGRRSKTISLSFVDNPHSRKSQEYKLTGKDKRENLPQAASPQALLDCNANKISSNHMIEQAKTENAQSRRHKRKRNKRKPPKFLPNMPKIKDFLSPEKTDERENSAELIFVPGSARLSMSISPQVSSYRPCLRMCEMSNIDSSSGYSEAKGEQPNLVRRTMSERSLSSLAQVLPSIPSSGSSISSLFHLANLHGSRERDILDLGEDDIINVVI